MIKLKEKEAIVIWVVANLLDSVLTFMGLRMGHEEIWLVLPVVHSMYWVTVAKWCGVLLVVCVLTQINRLRWLWWFTLGMGLVVLWNLIALTWH